MAQIAFRTVVCSWLLVRIWWPRLVKFFSSFTFHSIHEQMYSLRSSELVASHKKIEIAACQFLCGRYDMYFPPRGVIEKSITTLQVIKSELYMPFKKEKKKVSYIALKSHAIIRAGRRVQNLPAGSGWLGSAQQIFFNELSMDFCSFGFFLTSCASILLVSLTS